MGKSKRRTGFGTTKEGKCFLGFFLLCAFCFAQTPDIVRVEYMVMPKNNADISLSRLKLVANIPIKVGESDHIVIGSEYNRLVYDQQGSTSFNGTDLKRFHVLDLNLAYVYKYTNEWQFIGVVTPRLSSTLTNGLEQGDLTLNVTAGVFKTKKDVEKPIKLVLGLAYNSTSAIRIPLPVVYYEKRFHPNWAYVLGVPKSALKYYCGEKHMIQTELLMDGYYVNIQNSIFLPGGNVASAISSSGGVVTLGYQYSIKKGMMVYLYGGHTLLKSDVFRDTDRNNIFTLNKEPSFYFRTGFRIGI